MRFKKILHSPTSTNHNLTHDFPLETTSCGSGVRSRFSGSCSAGVSFEQERMQRLICT